jgi:hypothetical protein
MTSNYDLKKVYCINVLYVDYSKKKDEKKSIQVLVVVTSLRSRNA